MCAWVPHDALRPPPAPAVRPSLAPARRGPPQGLNSLVRPPRTRSARARRRRRRGAALAGGTPPATVGKRRGCACECLHRRVQKGIATPSQETARRLDGPWCVTPVRKSRGRTPPHRSEAGGVASHCAGGCNRAHMRIGMCALPGTSAADGGARQRRTRRQAAAGTALGHVCAPQTRAGACTLRHALAQGLARGYCTASPARLRRAQRQRAARVRRTGAVQGPVALFSRSKQVGKCSSRNQRIVRSVLPLPPPAVPHAPPRPTATAWQRCSGAAEK
ncbi:MAG: hypothetical protein J3K34DRAFT_440584, partial [Monoraphidium minutum]